MQKLIGALTLAAMTTAASAQVTYSPNQLNIPAPSLQFGKPLTGPASPNLKLRDHKTGAVFGTVTVNGNTLYLRNLNDELIGTVVTNGSQKTFFDAKGNVVDSLTFAGPPVKAPEQP